MLCVLAKWELGTQRARQRFVVGYLAAMQRIGSVLEPGLRAKRCNAKRLQCKRR